MPRYRVEARGSVETWQEGQHTQRREDLSGIITSRLPVIRELSITSRKPTPRTSLVTAWRIINPQRWCEAAFQPHCDGIHPVACPELCFKPLLSRRDTCIALPQTYI